MIEENKTNNKEVSLETLIRVANSGYSKNMVYGRSGIAKTYQELKLLSDDDRLIREALIKSDYTKDPDFEDLESSMELFYRG